jgi:hypothetical protein
MKLSHLQWLRGQNHSRENSSFIKWCIVYFGRQHSAIYFLESTMLNEKSEREDDETYEWWRTLDEESDVTKSTVML